MCPQRPIIKGVSNVARTQIVCKEEDLKSILLLQENQNWINVLSRLCCGEQLQSFEASQVDNYTRLQIKDDLICLILGRTTEV